MAFVFMKHLRISINCLIQQGSQHALVLMDLEPCAENGECIGIN